MTVLNDQCLRNSTTEGDTSHRLGSALHPTRTGDALSPNTKLIGGAEREDGEMKAARYCGFFALAQRFFAAAAILARASGLMTLLAFALAFGAAADF